MANKMATELNIEKSKALYARHFILGLVLVQPRKTGKHPNMTEQLLTGT